ncbi:MAG: phosphonate C-P lyase system protein PhnL [Deltaproteobacteria bacterium]|nr:phosphonate C-P lyase system protein PhnL [Deltaproteobacteria bacterium]
MPTTDPQVMVKVCALSKTFTLHLAGPAVLPALRDVSLEVRAGECLAVVGPSGAGKSTLLRCLFGNCRLTSGEAWIRRRGRLIALSQASPRTVMALRETTLGYVSQFLRVIPRVGALDVAAEPLVSLGRSPEEARAAAGELLERLRIPRRLWTLAPSTFSGGEKQRVNIARGLVKSSPVLLLDEPTASLDAANKRTAAELINEAKARGAAVVGVFHDREVRDMVADQTLELRPIGGGRPLEELA